MGHARRDMWREPCARFGHQGRRGDAFHRKHHLMASGLDPRAEAESADRQAAWKYLDCLREDEERYAAEAAASKAELAAELARYAAEAAADKDAAAAEEEDDYDSDSDSDGDGADSDSDGDGGGGGDGEAEAEAKEAAASLSEQIRRVIEGCPDEIVDLPNVAASTLDTVLEYCNKHADAGDAAATKPDCDPTASTVAGGSSSSSVNAAASEDLEVWDRELLDLLPLNALHDLLLAANYLEIEGLLDAICQKVADMIKGKTTDEVRATFNIDNDFTKAEEEELRKQFAWEFDE